MYTLFRTIIDLRVLSIQSQLTILNNSKLLFYSLSPLLVVYVQRLMLPSISIRKKKILNPFILLLLDFKISFQDFFSNILIKFVHRVHYTFQ